MAISTHAFTDIGHPSGTNNDPTCPRPATLYIPDPLVHPQPWHCVAGTVSGYFSEGGNAIVPVMQDLANAGYLCLFNIVRLMVNPISGQTTDGKYPQQTDDMKVAIRFMRSNPGGLGYSVTGKVVAIGGSASAHHALYMALDGTAGDDKADAAICMSPVTDMSNRDTVSGVFTNVVRLYGRTNLIPGDDLTLLLSESPIALDLQNAKPIRHYNGDHESMPLTEFTRFSGAMIAAGGVGAVKYSPILNTDVSYNRLHSFDQWPFIKDGAIQWLSEVLSPAMPPMTSSSTGLVGQYQSYMWK